LILKTVNVEDNMASLGSYGMCQTACNAAVCSCYASAGFVFGTVTAGAGVPAAIVTCNSILGICMSVCATKFLAEATAETAATGGVMAPVLVLGGLGIAICGIFLTIV
jgi:hypothetical protein